MYKLQIIDNAENCNHFLQFLGKGDIKKLGVSKPILTDEQTKQKRIS